MADAPTAVREPYESAEILSARESRRAGLAARCEALLKEWAGLPAEERTREYLRVRGEFFFHPKEVGRRIALLDRHVPGRREEVGRAAERILRHEFDILGSGFRNLGEPIDWHKDFKSGVSWRPDVLYPTWNWRNVGMTAGQEIYQGHFYSVDDRSDLKVPWDLSSFFHLGTLGEASWHENGGRFAEELLAQLRDWHARNPFPYGVNWTCAMVAGIRLANLMFALRLTESQPGHGRFMGESGLVSIVQHLRFILDNLEVDQDGKRNNHYLNNLVGLAFGGAELAGHPLGKALLDFAHEEIERELVVQFSPDGTNFEGTLPYHRFATESALLVVLLLDHNGRKPTPRTLDQLGRMMRFIDLYTKSNGLAPQFGDNDNGRILVLHRYAGQEYRDHRHILAVGSAYLETEPALTDVTDQSADTIWLLGRPAPAKHSRPSVGLHAGCHADNGFLVAKSGPGSLIVRCGRLNPMSGGGHNHCDQLSFEFHDDGCDLVVDPGAYVYSADAGARNNHRSTEAHNVVQFEDREQQTFDPKDLFAMQDRCRAAIDLWSVSPDTVRFRGHHDGHAEDGWRIDREIAWAPAVGRLRLCERPQAAGPGPRAGTFCGRLHLAAGIEVLAEDAGGFMLRAGAKRWRLTFEGAPAVSVRSGEVSVSYGVREPAAVVEYRFTAEVGRGAAVVLERVASA
ncbi:MAG: heparinase II/III domain-containing protein [Opitutaceae bacterium]